MALDFGVLGPLQMTANGASLVIAAWEQFPPPEPTASLHSYVSNLRKLVAGAGLDAKTGQQAPAYLRDRSGRAHPLLAAATRIGRLPDNEIVLDDAGVSRHHAVIIDTGTSYVVTDLHSANGVDVRNQRIRGTATVGHGDRIRICDHEFTFEVRQPAAP